MNWMSSAAQIEQARLDELNRKAEARAQVRRCREAELRAAVAEQRAKKARADADRKVAMLVLATAAMACMILGVCVMRASAWIGEMPLRPSASQTPPSSREANCIQATVCARRRLMAASSRLGPKRLNSSVRPAAPPSEVMTNCSGSSGVCQSGRARTTITSTPVYRATSTAPISASAAAISSGPRLSCPPRAIQRATVAKRPFSSACCCSSGRKASQAYRIRPVR